MTGIFTDYKKVGIIVVAPVLILVGAVFALPSVNQELAQIIGFVYYLIVFFAVAWSQLNLRNVKADLEKQAGTTTISKSMDLDEAMETLREWTKDNYADGNEVHFQWSSTHYETTVEKDPTTGDEYMFYAFITYGEFNRLTLFCIEGKNGDIVSHKPARYEDMLRNPFDYVPMVQELRRKSWAYNDGSGDMPFPSGSTARQDNANWQPVYQSQGNNAPLQQAMPRQGQQRGLPNNGQQENYTEVRQEDENENGDEN